MPLDNLRLEKIRDQTIGWLKEIADNEGVGSKMEIDPNSEPVACQVRNKGKKLVMELHRPDTRVEPETVYKMFLKILLTESDKGAIIYSSEISDEVGNLAKLYGINLIPMKTRSGMERSLKKIFVDVFS
ncbi:MAG: hypothetical protein ACE5KG_07485 [Nitrososphaerales archaeon]